MYQFLSDWSHWPWPYANQVPTAHEADTLSTRPSGMDDRHKLDSMYFRCLQSRCGLIKIDRRMNQEVKRTVSVRENMNHRANRNVFKWFIHAEHSCAERLTRRVYEFEVEGGNDRGMPCTM